MPVDAEQILDVVADFVREDIPSAKLTGGPEPGPNSSKKIEIEITCVAGTIDGSLADWENGTNGPMALRNSRTFVVWYRLPSSCCQVVCVSS